MRGLRQMGGQITPEGPSLYPLANYKLGKVLGKGCFGEVCAHMDCDGDACMHAIHCLHALAGEASHRQ